MKSIYSLQILQRILDHWGVGLINNVSYFNKVGSNIWRHHLDTNQGRFELYSFPANVFDYAKQKLLIFLQDNHVSQAQQIDKARVVHAFDRYHFLLQFEKKHQISAKQAYGNLDLLLGTTINKAFRSYGPIMLIDLVHSSTNEMIHLFSYGGWKIYEHKDGQTGLLVDSWIQSYQELDYALQKIEQNKQIVEKCVLKGDQFKLYIFGGMSVTFEKSDFYPAIEITLASRNNHLQIFEESEIYYIKELCSFL